KRQPLGAVRISVPLTLKSLLLASEMTTLPSVVKAGADPFCARSAEILVPPVAGEVVVAAAAVIAVQVSSTAAVRATRRVFINFLLANGTTIRVPPPLTPSAPFVPSPLDGKSGPPQRDAWLFAWQGLNMWRRLRQPLGETAY